MSTDPHSSSATSRLKRELLFAAAGVLLGFVVLPFCIYGVGQLILGAYAGGKQGFASFYGDLMRSLAAPEFNGWAIVLAPYLMLLGLRLIFLRRAVDNEPPIQKVTVKVLPRDKQRREPTLGA